MISAGMLDRKITIQQSSTTRDAMGAPIEGFATQYANVPAMVKYIAGKEKFHVKSDREISYNQIKFTIRYISGLNEKNRIVFEGKNYDILFIAELTRREGLEIVGQLAE